MSFNYKRVLLVGATAGIGAAFADKLIQEGAKVIAVGRRQERLDAFVQKHGPEKASGVRFDVNDIAGMDAFVEKIVTTYPDLDCVFLNSGTQHPVRLSRPAEVDLAAFHAEIATNFSRLVDLSLKFLPHLLAKPVPTALVVTGTNLAMVPAVTLSAYSASKAALHAYLLCLRRQHQGARTKIVEIWPPVVQTELHDYMGPEVGRAMGMPVVEFVDRAWAQLATGSEHVIIGSIGPENEFLDLVSRRRKAFDALSDGMLAHFEL
ncbi:24ef7a7e-2341-47dc-8cb3-e8a86d3d2e6f [Thermothielavioides terrestris]|uniref:24ef7a7e-2341-47dc-8cb3-e8a86d3d2e6f n=1 Tax=Thermothielavioides terrestris TaxID=2587410 RepID=A0A446BP60_9PEZI|nr:24ef7a7e-2341-47dc-8cb3-e8a86d3d2e6f [Thermothielavioides terrestris]